MFSKNKILILILIILVAAGAFLIIRFLPGEPIKTAEQYRQEGKNYFLAAEYKKAKEIYLKSLELDPDCPVAHYQLGNIFIELGDYQLAKEYFNKTLDLNPDPLIRKGSYLGIGGAYFSAREYGKAVDYIMKSLSEEITSRAERELLESTAYPLLGNAFYFLGDFAASEEYLQRALALELENNPSLEVVTQAKAYNSLGFLYLLLGEYQQALEYFNESIAMDKVLILATDIPVSQIRFLPYFGRSMVYHALKDYDKARESLEKSLELLRLYPQLLQYAFYEAQIYNKLGKTALDMEDFISAEKYFKQVLEMKEEDRFDTNFQAAYTQVDAYDGLGEIALHFKNYTEAQNYFERGLNEIPEGPFNLFQDKFSFGFMEILFHYRKAFTYYKMDNLLEAKREIKKSVELTESISPEIYSIIEKLRWFKDGESIFQKVYSLQNELES